MSPGTHFEPDGGTSVDTDNFKWKYNRNANVALQSSSPYVDAEYTIPVTGDIATPAEGLAPASGSYTDTAGATHTAILTTEAALYGASFSVNGSSQWYSGSPSLTSLSMSYTFPSDASGDYTVEALAYPYNADGTSYGDPTTYYYTLTVSSGTTTTTSQGDNSPNCDSCTDSCSACTQPTTPTYTSYHLCGIHDIYASGDHSRQASCLLTNGWGHSCTVTNFHACLAHTCVFPTFQCANASCLRQVADSEEHRRWCVNGRKYWSCNTGLNGVEHHRTRTCTRFKALRQVTDPLTGLKTVVWGTCGEQWDMCDTRCRDVYGAVGTHQE